MSRGKIGIAVAIAACASWTTPLREAHGAHRQRAMIRLEEPKPVTVNSVPSGSLKGKTAPEWVTAKPPRATQHQKSPAERGINPCMTRDPGFGAYTGWDRSPTIGQMILPRNLRLRNGRFDLMVHFHGHEAARKEWVQAIDGAVLVGIDLGTGSGPYRNKFESPAQFRQLVASVERRVAEQSGHPHAKVGHLGLSAWSAGYGAVARVLDSPAARSVDTVVLLDGLHTGYEQPGVLNGLKLAPFVDFARRAARGQTLMFVSHSSIVPPGYASTTETANYLVWGVGGQPALATARDSDPMGLELISRYSRGDFHVRGFSGNGTLDHCAQLGLYRDVLSVHVAPRWGLPRARPAQLLARATP